MVYRVGIVGVGPKKRTSERGGGFAIGRLHANAWAKIPIANLASACDLNLENLDSFADHYSLDEKFTDYSSMLGEANLDIVDICTWPTLHCGMVVAAAQAGVKAVYCEKPMCLSLDEARRMIDACDANDVRLAVSHQRRFSKHFQTAKTWIKTGRIGDVVEIHGRIGGADADMLSWGTHWFDMFNFLLDDIPVKSVFAQADCSSAIIRYGHPVEDRALVSVHYDGGVRCYLEGGPEISPSDMRVVGTEGHIHIGKSVSGWLDHGACFTEETTDGALDFAQCFYTAFEDLVESIRGRREPALSGRLAFNTTEVIMAAYESSLTRKIIQLPLATSLFPLHQRAEFKRR